MNRKQKYKPTLETIHQNEIFVPKKKSKMERLDEKIQAFLEIYHLTPCSTFVRHSKLFRKLCCDFFMLRKENPFHDRYLEILTYISRRNFSKLIMDYIDVQSYKYSKLNGLLSKQNLDEIHHLLILPKVYFTKREEIELKNHMDFIHREEERMKILENKILS